MGEDRSLPEPTLPIPEGGMSENIEQNSPGPDEESPPKAHKTAEELQEEQEKAARAAEEQIAQISAALEQPGSQQDVDALMAQMNGLQAMAGELDDEEEAFLKSYENLKNLLQDAGRFHDLCEQGFREQGAELKDSRALCNALNLICKECGIDEVTMDEADELFVENMSAFELYNLAKPFFQAIVRTLDEDNDNLLGV